MPASLAILELYQLRAQRPAFIDLGLEPLITVRTEQVGQALQFNQRQAEGIDQVGVFLRGTLSALILRHLTQVAGDLPVATDRTLVFGVKFGHADLQRFRPGIALDRCCPGAPPGG